MSFHLTGWALRLGWLVVFAVLLPADGEPATETTVLSQSLIVGNTFFILEGELVLLRFSL